ncbi:MAG: 4-hydroxy-tetrahydrodipicolinate reductase [Candidatus Omnitrophica bacterium]|nr:4-hydroxy-tetrahydrodipicolinate reductase [Candidatus Omnitrophota bacterium]MBU1995872.1 4-hydroxy-tetrahydrodipicolinate reductase [Candidatus Omnitrophota bacterium]MBU4332956.1 4-hydroxy-tetrahydrodipicolinate reductase [Candidatus Omnitrophota bacterium]
MIKLAISGSMGRMGQKIYDLASKDSRFKVTTLLEHKANPSVGKKIAGIEITSDISKLEGSAVLIDFTLPDGTIEKLDACIKNKVAMVIGTTGFTKEQSNKIEEASNEIPIVFASNMSIGVNVMFKATELVSKKLKDIQSIKVYEEHHCHKKDAPSGTAKTIANIAEENSNKKVVFEPEPLREGEIIGNHEITFDSEFDIFKMYHHAKDRNMFALGSLEAAAFLNHKHAGLFNMQQVLGLDSIKIN